MAIEIIEVRSEIAAGTRGASLGIEAMKVAARKNGDTFFGRYHSRRVEDFNHLLDEDVVFPFAKRIKGVAEVYNHVCDTVSNVIDDNNFPIVLAADHASAGGTIAGIKKAFPNQRLGVVWVDAHADLQTPYTTSSGNMHGMPLATAIATDNEDKMNNEVDNEVAKLWDQMKNTGGIHPKIKPEDLVFIAARAIEDPEKYLMNKYGIRNFTVEEVNERGAKQIAEESISYLRECDIIYVSFDVDSMDCDVVSRGTGTPVPNGLLPEEAKEIMETLLAENNVVCFEVVEVNPCLDDKVNVMAETAFTILKASTDIVEKRL